MNFDPFLTYLISEKRSSPHTVEAYRNDLEQFSAFCIRTFETSDPAEVSRQMVRSWLASLMEEQYMVSSVHRKLSSINAYFRFQVRSGILRINPAKGLSKPKIPKRLPAFVEEKGTMKLYEDLPENNFSAVRDRIIVTLFYETGIRLSELLQLQDADIDTSLHQVKVLGKRQKTRYVPVSGALLKLIKNYTNLRDAENFETQSPELFVSDRGKKLSRSFVYLAVKKYLSQVTTSEKKSPHILRHSFATHMLNNGADLNVIKEILGHSSLAATQVYTHNSVEKLKRIHSGMHPRNNQSINP